DGALRQDAQACFYLYRQVMGNRTAPGGFLSPAGGEDQGEGACFTGQHSQLGLVAVASCEDYLRDVIKKHELTRPDKEEDRMRHSEPLNAQTGPVFLTYRAVPALNDFFRRVASGEPHVDFVAPDGVRHSSWTIADVASIRQLEEQFVAIPFLYIADGHHR